MNSNDLEKFAKIVGVPIYDLSAETMTKILSAPQGQKRTARFKKAVKIDGNLVFKGPYRCDDPKLMNNLKYTYAIELLETILQLPEWQRGSLRWEYIGYGDENQNYLVAPNVGKHENIPFERVTTKIETNVKVIPRGGHVERVSDIEGTGRLTDNIKLAALQHLYLRFLLDVGDSMTQNVLIREDCHRNGRLIAGVDLEEIRAIREKERRLDHLFKKAASKKQVSLYQSDVCKIRSLSIDLLDPRTLERLCAVGIDLERFKGNIGLWESLN